MAEIHYLPRPPKPPKTFRRPETAYYIKVDAEALVAEIGQNPYSTYLLKFLKRPDPETAKAIGTLMAARVKANDGRLYPPLTPAQKEYRRQVKERQAESTRQYTDRWHLLYGVSYLADLPDDAERVIAGLSPKEHEAVEAKIELATERLAQYKRALEHKNKGP